MNLKKKRSTQTALIATATVILLMIVSILISILPEGYLTADVTSNKMYTLSDYTKQVLGDNEEKVELCLVSTGSAPNESIRNLLSKYDKINKNISVRILYTDIDMDEIKAYTESPVSGSVIVRSGKRSVYLPYNSFFGYSRDAEAAAFYIYNVYYTEEYIDCSYTEFKELYGGSLGLYDGYCYENEITQAIRYCTGDSLKTVYLMSAGEGQGFGYGLTDMIRDGMTEIKAFPADAQSIPDDADAVMLTAYADISSRNREMLSDYAKNGGKILLMSSGTSEKPELSALCEEMGIRLTGDTVFEDNENYRFGEYSALVIPDVNDEESGEKLSQAGASVVMLGATSVKISEDLPDGVEVQPILVTSPEAYTKSDISNGFEFNEEQDKRGIHNLAVRAVNSAGGTLTVVSSAVYINDDYDIYSDNGNKIFTVSLLRQLTNGVEAEEIPPVKSSDQTVYGNAAFKASFVIMTVVFISLTAYLFLRVKKQLFCGKKLNTSIG